MKDPFNYAKTIKALGMYYIFFSSSMPRFLQASTTKWKKEWYLLPTPPLLEKVLPVVNIAHDLSNWSIGVEKILMALYPFILYKYMEI